MTNEEIIQKWEEKYDVHDFWEEHWEKVDVWCFICEEEATKMDIELEENMCDNCFKVLLDEYQELKGIYDELDYEYYLNNQPFI